MKEKTGSSEEEKVHFPKANLFGSRTLGIDFRPFQKEILKKIKKKLQYGERQLHIVSPPGTGKTLIGLELVEYIGLPAIVLCPNTTIQAQWPAKAERFIMDTDALAEKLPDNLPLVSTNPGVRSPVIALTYQLFSAREDKTKEAERTFTELITSGYKTLVFDECHHLTNLWADIILAFLKKHSDSFIIGLTATPPMDRSNKEQTRFLDIVGDVDAEVPLPAVIRDGLLTPFQDLARFVVPTERESRFIQHRFEAIEEILSLFMHPPEGIDSLSMWVEERMLKPQWRGKTYDDFIHLSVKVPAFAIALCRFFRSRGLALPEEVIEPEEVPQPLGIKDIALLVEDYVQNHLLTLHTKETEELTRRALKTMKLFGFEYENQKLVQRDSTVSRVLAFSGAKLAAMRDILIKEKEFMADELRVLVLTDFISAHVMEKTKQRDIFDPQAGGAVAAFRALLAHPETDELDPILVTGQVILVDDDIADCVLSDAQTFFAEKNIDTEISLKKREDFYSLEGSGPGWNTKTYVRLLTGLLEKGTTHCIVGTRALFGEGWDCEPLNTLIDLTGVSSFVTVNQIRGRTLRLDPHNPAKVANNWDIVAILPDIAGGEVDLERFFIKHQRFYGPTDDGDLELGAGHVHPALTHQARDSFYDSMDTINRDLLSWAGNRSRAFHTWKVGDSYRGEEVSSLSIFGPSPQWSDSGVVEEGVPDTKIAIIDGKKLPVKGHHGFLGVFPILGVILLLILKSLFFLVPLLASAFLTILANHFMLVFRVKRARQKIPLLEFMERASRAICNAMKKLRLISHDAHPVVSRRSDGSIRLRLENATEKHCMRFVNAVKELLGQYRGQRYMLVTYKPYVPFFAPWVSLYWEQMLFRRKTLAYPVPEILGKKSLRAETFEKEWTSCFGPSRVFFVKGEKNAARLSRLFPLSEKRIRLKRVVHRLWR